MKETQYTIEEIKQKLIELTNKYVNLESYDNKEARELMHSIDVCIRSIYWSGRKETINNLELEPNDIVEFVDFSGETKRGYITEDMKIRCPHPVYETHLIKNNTVLIKKQGWK